MKKLNKIIGINFLLFLGYAGFMHLICWGQMAEAGITVFFICLAHFVVCLIASLVFFFSKKSEEGQAYLLSALLLAVTGFSYCFGILSGVNL